MGSTEVPFGIRVEGKHNFQEKSVVIGELSLKELDFKDQSIFDLVLIL